MLVLIIVTLSGAAFRLHRLGAESLWLDEATSVWMASQSPATLVAETAADVHPPAYYLALRWWMSLAGRSEASLRLLSVAAGVLSIMVVYGIGARLWGRGAGLAASAMVATSPFHIHYSQEARMYALLGLCALGSAWALVRWIDTRTRVAGIVYVLATTLMLYTHVYAFFVLAAEWLWVLGGTRRARARFTETAVPWWTLQAAIGVLLLPWLPALAAQVVRVQTLFWIEPWPLTELPRAFGVLAGGGPLALGMLALAAAGAWRARDRPYSGAWLLAALALIPVMAPILLSEVGSPIFLPKYALPASLAIALLAARGLTRLPALVRMAAGVALIGCGIWSVPVANERLHNDEWREAVAYVERDALPGDLVLFSQPWGRIPFDYYIRRRDLVADRLYVAPGSEPAETLHGLVRIGGEYRRTWWIMTNTGPLIDALRPELPAWFETVAHRPLQGVAVYLLEPTARTRPRPAWPRRPPE